jgi:hypothetical protein
VWRKETFHETRGRHKTLEATDCVQPTIKQMAIYFFNILYNPCTQCQNRKIRTRQFTATDTPYIRQVGWNIDINYIAASESRRALTNNFLKFQFFCFLTKVFEPSDEGTRSVCSLTFIATCIVIYFYSNTDQIHQSLKIILFWNKSTCFGRSFLLSSGVHDCTYSNRHVANRYCSLLASVNSMEFHLVHASKQ